MFARVLKRNDVHDALGRFAKKPGSGLPYAANLKKKPIDPLGGIPLTGVKGNIGNFPKDKRNKEEIMAAIYGKLSAEQHANMQKFEEDMKGKPSSADLHGTVVGKNKRGENIYKWSEERTKHHDEIIAEFFKDSEQYKAKDGEKPSLVMLAGRGGSGKSSLTAPDTTPIKNIEKYKHLDPDKIKDKLKGYNGVNAGLYHEESSYLNDTILQLSILKRLNVVQDVTMKSQPGVEEALQSAHRMGYELQGHLMHLPVEDAGVRVMARAVGPEKRYVPLHIIAANVDNEQNFQNLVNRGYFQKWSVHRNDVPRGQKPVLVSKKP